MMRSRFTVICNIKLPKPRKISDGLYNFLEIEKWILQAVTTKTSQQEVDSFKIKRLEEEKSILRKKLERTKKMEKMENWDEVLNEEIRELKVNLFRSYFFFYSAWFVFQRGGWELH